jgi:hypothetical protein
MLLAIEADNCENQSLTSHDIMSANTSSTARSTRPHRAFISVECIR